MHLTASGSNGARVAPGRRGGLPETLAAPQDGPPAAGCSIASQQVQSCQLPIAPRLWPAGGMASSLIVTPPSVLECCSCASLAAALSDQSPYRDVDHLIDVARAVWWHQVCAQKKSFAPCPPWPPPPPARRRPPPSDASAHPWPADACGWVAGGLRCPPQDRRPGGSAQEVRSLCSYEPGRASRRRGVGVAGHAAGAPLPAPPLRCVRKPFLLYLAA
jgi:hypothetical protein